MKRITPEEVLQAYQSTELKPVQKKYFDACEVCGLSAYYLATTENVKKDTGALFDTLTSKGFHPDYLHGFWVGFDGHTVDWSVTEEVSQGIEDGQAAWKAVKHLSLETEETNT